jgi:hypothetical protein
MKKDEPKFEIVLREGKEGEVFTRITSNKVIMYFNEDDYKKIPPDIKEAMIRETLKRVTPLLEQRAKVIGLGKSLNILSLVIASWMGTTAFINFTKGEYLWGTLFTVLSVINWVSAFNIYPRHKIGKRWGLFGKEQEEDENEQN